MRPGTVSLVGAGPGDPELLTVKARRLLDEADAVCVDPGVSEAIRDLPPRSVERIEVAGDATADVATLLARRATAGDDVVRLTAGDPCVFGPGGAIAERLARADVPVDVVPGIASVLAAPSLAGVPPTHRDHASSVILVGDPTDADCGALARSVTAGGTLVIAAGLDRLPGAVAALRDEGVDPGMPAAVVERAAPPRAVVGTLETVADRAEGVDPPAVAVVGDVVAVRDRVAAWRRGGAAARTASGGDPPMPTD